MVLSFSFSYCFHLLIRVETLAGRVYCTNDQIIYGIIYCRYQKITLNESLSTYSYPIYLYHLSFYDSL